MSKLLLSHIRNGRNDEANAMLNEELAQAFDDSDFHGTLLHHAATYNAVIARRLIELGADVNRLGRRFSTPLMLAIIHKNAAAVEVLLKAGARVDLADVRGRSPLLLGLQCKHVDSETCKLLISKLRSDAGTNEELVEILIRAKCNMCHAATMRDVGLVECMLKRGVDVDSKDADGSTALHVAVSLNDRKMADWLLKKGIDVDAVDEYGSSALVRSVERRNVTMVTFLLEHGACPGVKEGSHDYPPLSEALRCLNSDKYVECAELLLQHGASFRDSDDLLDKFEFALECSCDRAGKLLIAHMAMLEMLGEPVNKSAMESVYDSCRMRVFELQKYCEPCRQILRIEVFEKLSLLDLLNESDGKLRLLVRTESFLQEVERVSFEHKLSEIYSYYYNTMMTRIAKARRVVKLENEAILVICKIFKANYNQFYDFARGLVEYLNERDLEHLVQV